MLDLRTERLDLRPLEADDIAAFVAYRRDPEVARFQGWEPTYTTADAEDLVDAQPAGIETPGEWLQLAIIERASGTLCGDCAVRLDPVQPRTAEVGITLARAHQGRGIAREAVDALLEWLFGEQALHRVFAQTDDRNTAVHHLFEHLGFRLEGRLVDADWYKGEWTTLRIYARLAGDAPAAPGDPARD